MADYIRKFSVQETEKTLKKQKIIFAFLNSSTPEDSLYKNYYLPLKELFGKVIIFDPSRIALSYGKEKMEKMFLSLAEKENPNYIFVSFRRDEISLEFIGQIRASCPDAKIIFYSGDDDRDFDSITEYYALFMDCMLIAQIDYLKRYHDNGIMNAIPTLSINTKILKPIKTEKIYDVSFIGNASDERAEIIRHLVKNGVNVRVFGNLWENYPELKSNYEKPLSLDEVAKVVNQTKINLGISRNKYGRTSFKWRIFEISACRAFSLTDYFPGYLKFFRDNKEIVMFKNDEDLLEKIKYYLKHDKEREKIAENAYKKTIKNHDVTEDFKKIFKKIIENPEIFSQKFPKINGRIITFTKKDMKKNDAEIKEMLEEFEYVNFDDGNSIPLKYRDYLQVYSLEKTKKPVSICDCYVHDKILGDYLASNSSRALNLMDKKNFNSAISINQVAVSKDYFLKNLNNFRRIFYGKPFFAATEKNISFISIPLVRIKSINQMNFQAFSVFFHQKNFVSEILRLRKQRRLFFSRYFYRLMFLFFMSNPIKKFFINLIRRRFKKP